MNIPTPEERPDLYEFMAAHRLLPDGRLLYLTREIFVVRLNVTCDIDSIDDMW
jgi:hypothetical protein